MSKSGSGLDGGRPIGTTTRRAVEDVALRGFVLIVVDERCAQSHAKSALDLLVHERLQRLKHKNHAVRPVASGEGLVTERFTIGRSARASHFVAIRPCRRRSFFSSAAGSHTLPRFAKLQDSLYV